MANKIDYTSTDFDGGVYIDSGQSILNNQVSDIYPTSVDTSFHQLNDNHTIIDAVFDGHVPYSIAKALHNNPSKLLKMLQFDVKNKPFLISLVSHRIKYLSEINRKLTREEIDEINYLYEWCIQNNGTKAVDFSDIAFLLNEENYWIFYFGLSDTTQFSKGLKSSLVWFSPKNLSYLDDFADGLNVIVARNNGDVFDSAMKMVHLKVFQDAILFLKKIFIMIPSQTHHLLKNIKVDAPLDWFDYANFVMILFEITVDVCITIRDLILVTILDEILLQMFVSVLVSMHSLFALGNEKSSGSKLFSTLSPEYFDVLSKNKGNLPEVYKLVEWRLNSMLENLGSKDGIDFEPKWVAILMDFVFLLLEVTPFAALLVLSTLIGSLQKLFYVNEVVISPVYHTHFSGLFPDVTNDDMTNATNKVPFIR